jgi:hypothetical protein
MIKSKIKINQKHAIELDIKKDEILVDFKNIYVIISNPLLIKVGLSLKSILPKSNRKLKLKNSIFKNLFTK